MEYVFIPLTDVPLTISKQLSYVLFHIIKDFRTKLIQGNISILVSLYSNVKLQLYSQVEVEVSNF